MPAIKVDDSTQQEVRALQFPAVGQDPFLDDDRDAVTDDAGLVFASGVDSAFIDNLHALADAAILIEYCVFDIATAPDSP